MPCHDQAGDDLSRAHLKLHLFGPDGGPVMDPLTVDIKQGKDMWFARDSSGKTDSSQGGDGGVAKVSSICSLIFISDFSHAVSLPFFYLYGK